jgi:protein O-mannosyl-transferase
MTKGAGRNQLYSSSEGGPVSSVGLQSGEEVQSRPSGLLASAAVRAFCYGILLFLLTAALYYPVRTHPFVNYDDNVYVNDNDHVKDGLSGDTILWAFTTYDAGNWHPVTWLSHALDVQMYDIEPAGHHLTNLLLHAANAVLLFWVLLSATGYAGRSWMVAALFAVHPLNVEPVVWIAERKTILSMSFFLLALGAYGWYAAKPKMARYVTVAALFSLGLMAKPQVITFPFVLLLWDYWPLKRMSFIGGDPTRVDSNGKAIPQKSLRALIEEKIPLFAIAAASAAITMKAQRASHAVLSFGAIPLSIRLSNAIVSYVRYIQKCFWPAGLAPMYPHPGRSLHAWQVYGALAILLAITMFVFEKRSRRYLLVGWLWFMGTLVPMIGLVQVGHQAMADRYAYLPLLGIFVMVCWGAADWAVEKRLPSQLLPVLSLLIVLVLTIVARRQIGYWADNALLWTHTIEVTAPNYVAEDNLAGTLLTRKRPDEAIVHYRNAAAIHPTDPISAFNIGLYEQQHGELRQAIEHYKQAITLTLRPSLQIPALNNMGQVYNALGDTEQARQCFAQARKLQGP